jgi:uncharacterized protein (DUF427 family)
MQDLVMGQLAHLRHEPTQKRVRATLGGQTVIDSRRAMLVWEPRRIVPTYAVPAADLAADLVPADLLPEPSRPILHPGIPFGEHSTPGQPYTVRSGDETRDQAAFTPADADLDGYVVLDFTAFDSWFEEDEPIRGHPRDPYHRIDIRASSRRVKIERDGVLLADSQHPALLFETNLPVRYYLPRDDLRVAAKPSDKRSHCPYKGDASYLTFDVGENIAWCYSQPLSDAMGLAGMVAFYNELVDITVDGERQERPDTEFARSIVDNFRPG